MLAAGAPAQVLRISGSDQFAAPNTTFADPLVARVIDAGGAGVAGITVIFAVPRDDGTTPTGVFEGGVSWAAAVTDGNGYATSGRLRANAVSGTYGAVASAGGVWSAVYGLTNGLQPAQLVMGDAELTDHQSADIGKVFGERLLAEVLDSEGLPVAGVPVVFSAPASDTLPSATFEDGSTTNVAITGTNGFARSTYLRANQFKGAFEVVAWAGGVAQGLTFHLTNTTNTQYDLFRVSGNHQKLATLTPNVSADEPVPVVVGLRDKDGQPNISAYVTFTIHPGTNGAGAWFGSGTDTTYSTWGYGDVAAPKLHRNGIDGPFTIQVHADLPALDDVTFDIENIATVQDSVFAACPDWTSDYCIELLTANGVGVLADEWRVFAKQFDGNSVSWQVQRALGDGTWTDDLGAADLRFHFRLRLGAVKPAYTEMWAEEPALKIDTSATGGWVLDVEATPAEKQWLAGGSCTTWSCGDSSTQATSAGFILSGASQNLAKWGEGADARMAGMWIAHTAQASDVYPQLVLWPEASWVVTMANASLRADGTHMTGNYTAHIPGSFLAASGVSAETALSTGISVLRSDAGGTGTVAVGGEVTPDEGGGVYVRVRGVTFSTHAFDMSAARAGAVKLTGRPDPPTGTVARGVDGGAIFDLGAVRFDGGGAINAYTATCRAGRKVKTATVFFLVPLELDGLSNGTHYRCDVAAANAAGSSRALTFDVVPTRGALVEPGPAESLRLVTAKKGGSVISWQAPQAKGGGAIVDYRVTFASLTTGESSASISTVDKSLKAPTAKGRYLVQVEARNAAGYGRPALMTLTVT